MTTDNNRDCNEDFVNDGRLSQLVEINLFYAAAELLGARDDASALVRAVDHIQQALKDIQACRSGNEAG